jgi:hypothetical protein
MVISECVRCHSWGPVRPLGNCQTCINWMPRGGYTGRCHRCRHEGKVNRDGLCRLCMLEIRMVPDREWADAATRRTLGPVRDLQLPLLLEGVRLPVVLARHHDRPLVRERLRTERSAGPWIWAKRGDDLHVCPPQVTGQLPLLPRLPRTFTRQHGYRIAARDFPEWANVLQAVERVRGRRDLSAGWSESVVQMMRLALASREASEQLVDEYVVAELPRMRPAVAEVLREAGLLRRRLGSGLAQNGYRRERRRMVSCEHCRAWSGDARPLCDSCREWARQPDRASGPCLRCGRTWPLKNGQCRFCHLVMNEHVGDGPAVEQLWFGAGLGHGLYTKQPGDYSQGSRKSRRRELERREKQTRQADRRLSPHLINPHQLELFPPPARVWKRAQHTQLPTMTPKAEQLVAEFWQFTADQHWTIPSRDINAKVLRLLVAWLGIDAPLLEADVRAVTRLGPSWSGRRVAAFLDQRGLLVPLERTDPDQAALERLLLGVPDHLRDEADAWVRVLRGEGRKPSLTMNWVTIRRYAHFNVPALQQWGQRVSSLREITQKDIEDILSSRTGEQARSLHASLRSLFRALKRERVIFRDPARGVSVASTVNAPRRIPSDRLVGLLDKAPTAMAKVVVALVAIHALGPQEIRHQLLTGLDRPAGRLVVRRRFGDHVVYLDELTMKLLSDWLRERAERWPRSTNPHLLVTQVTVVDPNGPPVSKDGLRLIFRKLGIQPRTLRVDRLLDEAHETADPVHLMRVFGISDTTALKYVRAAHPHRFGQEPTQA